ncbi:MAG: bifunctional glutamate N-acetyltransferase/amino-acid acetyltransferase ArgJ [Candidatus Omnitrophica bacterium]|nr:bifunctional glutamate N-acetyltransferase/amino-acid acetyltransferase ArgJ [Candidatus Omnitrophota bacterium]MCM8801895.1 bifunctional glutamate N-acetyltransferase/amino-acid acetyltransferase ArgJ [Candidatus Omnitrophota bacterium]
MGKGITYPLGFYASGINCGIKESKNDLSLIYSKSPCICSGTFTTNQFKSYSVLWSMKNIKNKIRGILINSGNANTCNGKENWKLTQKIMEEIAKKLKIEKKTILFASTGIIGVPLPYEKIKNGLDKLIEKLSEDGNLEAAKGIMTTDTFPKEYEIKTNIQGRKKEVYIGGMAKGAGMINPSMATMLCFITTDAVIDKNALDLALKNAVEDSFNMITVDNDTSTNDTVIILANGLARNKTIHIGNPEFIEFSNALKTLCIELAKKIVMDGEGASKIIEVIVNGGWCKKDVRKVAKRVSGSMLVKTAISGGDPNWGRIIAAIGSTNARMDIKNIEIKICGIKVFEGEPVKFDRELLRELMKKKEIKIEIDLKRGIFTATSWGCDLTEEYVKINKEYS